MVLNVKQVANQPLDWFHADPDQPRKSFDLEELRLLASTLKVKQLVPLLAKPGGTIIDGERRWRAALLEGRPPRLDVIITDEPLTAAEVKEILLVTAAAPHADLTPYEQYLGCKSWLDANATATAHDLAVKIGRNPSTVSRILSLAALHPGRAGSRPGRSAGHQRLGGHRESRRSGPASTAGREAVGVEPRRPGTAEPQDA